MIVKDWNTSGREGDEATPDTTNERDMGAHILHPTPPADHWRVAGYKDEWVAQVAYESEGGYGE